MNSSRLTFGFYAILIIWIISLFWRSPYYGAEEDSFTAVCTAYESYTSGEYHMSRLPGHPVFEYLLRYTYDLRGLMWPLLIGLGALLSGIFTQKLTSYYKWDNKRQFLTLGLFLTPAMTIALTETMEYTLSLATLLMAWYYAEKRQALVAAICLALATGLRLPNLMYGLPIFLLLIQRTQWKWAVSFAALSFALSSVFYYPVWAKYGWDFFNTYDLPYPSLLKVVYKGTIGAWGIVGVVGLGVASLTIRWKDVLQNVTRWQNAPYLLALLFSLGLFLLLPEKSVFLLPFTFIFGVLFISRLETKWGYYGFALLILNPFLLGTDLVERYRGIPEEEADLQFTAGGQTMGVQILLPDPGAKRRNKHRSTDILSNAMRQLPEGSVVVTGWWYPMIEVELIDQPSFIDRKQLYHFYYIDESTMIDAMKEGKSIFYAPEAEIFNRQKYGHDLLSRYGQPLIDSETRP